MEEFSVANDGSIVPVSGEGESIGNLIDEALEAEDSSEQNLPNQNVVGLTKVALQPSIVSKHIDSRFDWMLSSKSIVSDTDRIVVMNYFGLLLQPIKQSNIVDTWKLITEFQNSVYDELTKSASYKFTTNRANITVNLDGSFFIHDATTPYAFENAAYKMVYAINTVMNNNLVGLTPSCLGCFASVKLSNILAPNAIPQDFSLLDLSVKNGSIKIYTSASEPNLMIALTNQATNSIVAVFPYRQSTEYQKATQIRARYVNLIQSFAGNNNLAIVEQNDSGAFVVVT